MAFEPLRFIHVHDARLDVPVRAGQALSEQHHELVSDARVGAFRRCMAACVEHEVDFLLLSGNTFTERSRDLRTRIVLRECFEELHSHNIAVFVIPDRSNPSDAWRSIPMLPANVSICDSWSTEPTAVVRDNTLIATVQNGRPAEEYDEFGIRRTRESSADVRDVFRIGVSAWRPDEVRAAAADRRDEEDEILTLESHLEDLFADSPADYIAIIGGGSVEELRVEQTVAHCPGHTQPDSPADSTEGRCSLVEVSLDGAVRVRAVPVAAVVFRQCELTFDIGETSEGVPDRMAASTRLESHGGERLWVIEWTIRGDLFLVEELEAEQTQSFLVQQFEADESRENPPAFAHAFRLLPRLDAATASPLAESFVSTLQSRPRVDPESLRKLCDGMELDEEWAERLRRLTPELDGERIAAKAMRLGLGWFGHLEDEAVDGLYEEGSAA